MVSVPCGAAVMLQDRTRIERAVAVGVMRRESRRSCGGALSGLHT